MGPRCFIMSEVIPRFLLIAGILAAALSARAEPVSRQAMFFKFVTRG